MRGGQPGVCPAVCWYWRKKIFKKTVPANSDVAFRACFLESPDLAAPAGFQLPFFLIDSMSQDAFRTDPPALAPGNHPVEAPVARRFSSRPVTATTAAEENVDNELVEQTRSQIRSLVQEITDLARGETSPEEFHEGFLVRTTSALASAGGALWIRPSADKPFDLKYQINLTQVLPADSPEARKTHAMLLQRVAARSEPVLVPPNSGFDGSDAAANPTDLLLIIGPLVVAGELVGLVEIFQRPGGGPATQRGYLRFLAQMCDVASDYLRNLRLRNYLQEQQLWLGLEKFSRRIHHGLDPQRTACELANEGRKLLDCDRVSVALAQGTVAKVVAVSGLDTIERRADQVKNLNRLASAVLRAGQPVWYEGDSSGIAPQIESVLQQYIDRSHSRMVAILPIVQDDPDSTAESSLTRKKNGHAGQPGKILGALILENLQDSRATAQLRQRTQLVAAHAGLALGNAIEHHSIFLMPLWKSLSWLRAPFATSRLPGTMLALTLLAAVALLMCIVPWPFTLGSRGQLIAERQQEIYAPSAGTLVQINEPEDPMQIIPEGEVLATLVNHELSLQRETVEGQLHETREQISKLGRTLNMETDPKNKTLLHGDIASQRQTERSLDNQLKLLMQQTADLQVRNPMTGRIANWQLRRNLLGRRVEAGQNLMTVVAPETAWQVELYLPEKRAGHLLQRSDQQDEPVAVSFTLASRPGEEFTGQVLSVDQVMDVYDDQGNAIRVLVGFDNGQLADELRRSGTRVTARLHCGIRPVGYVLFHELIETVSASVKLWF